MKKNEHFCENCQYEIYIPPPVKALVFDKVMGIYEEWCYCTRKCMMENLGNPKPYRIQSTHTYYIAPSQGRGRPKQVNP